MYAKWHVSKQLFAFSEARLAVLNRSGRDFFALCQHSFVSDILASAGRLLDPATHGKGKREKENLSLERLRNTIAAVGDNVLASSVAAKLEHVERLEAGAREHRNRRLAHNDLTTILVGGAALPAVTVADIDELLAGLADILNAVDRYYRGNTTFFADPIQEGDGTAVVRCLRDGLAYQEDAIHGKFAEDGLPPLPRTVPPEV
jgi:hypothetical protein